MTQPAPVVRFAKAPCVVVVLAAVQRTWLGHWHDYPERSVAFQREKSMLRRRTEWGQGFVEMVLVCVLIAVIVIVVLVVVRGQPAAPMNVVRALGAPPTPS
jgi:hypothetical protein